MQKGVKMPSNYPTLKDVSAEAGVSMALASVVLNGKKGRIKASEDTRRKILEAAEKLGAEVYMPPLSLCGDNGAMIGAQSYYEYLAGNVADMSLNAYATKSILGEKV